MELIHYLLNAYSKNEQGSLGYIKNTKDVRKNINITAKYTLTFKLVISVHFV